MERMVAEAEIEVVLDAQSVTVSETREIPLHQLRRLHDTTTWARGRTQAQLQAILRHSDIFLTAWDGATLVGCVRVLTDFVVRALVCDVIVDPAYQGLGLGRLLVEAVEAHPALRDVEQIALFTTRKRDFYAHLGWDDHPGHGMVLSKQRSAVSSQLTEG